MTKISEVYKDGDFRGFDVEANEIIEDYPFLKNENLNDCVLKIWDDQINISYYDKTPIIWKRNQMTGQWVDRIALL